MPTTKKPPTAAPAAKKPKPAKPMFSVLCTKCGTTNSWTGDIGQRPTKCKHCEAPFGARAIVGD